jgi:hypothetical protein
VTWVAAALAVALVVRVSQERSNPYEVIVEDFVLWLLAALLCVMVIW